MFFFSRPFVIFIACNSHPCPLGVYIPWWSVARDGSLDWMSFFKGGSMVIGSSADSLFRTRTSDRVASCIHKFIVNSASLFSVKTQSGNKYNLTPCLVVKARDGIANVVCNGYFTLPQTNSVKWLEPICSFLFFFHYHLKIEKKKKEESTQANTHPWASEK